MNVIDAIHCTLEPDEKFLIFLRSSPLIDVIQISHTVIKHEGKKNKINVGYRCALTKFVKFPRTSALYKIHQRKFYHESNIEK